jgi:hypothetical protein
VERERKELGDEATTSHHRYMKKNRELHLPELLVAGHWSLLITPAESPHRKSQLCGIVVGFKENSRKWFRV